MLDTEYIDGTKLSYPWLYLTLTIALIVSPNESAGERNGDKIIFQTKITDEP